MNHKRTARLSLRPIERGDAEALFAIWTDPDVAEFMNIESFIDATDVRHMIDFMNGLDDTKRCAIVYDECVIGTAGFQHIDEARNEAEIGYEIDKPYWRRGIGSTVVAMLIEEAKAIGWSRLTALIHPNNEASIRLVERLGFTLSCTVLTFDPPALCYEKMLDDE